MTGEERELLEAVRLDLRAEEDEQVGERGYASPRLLRATARLEQLLKPTS